MTSASSQNPKPSKGETRPWVLERMVHRAQPHLSETENRTFSPALILGSVVILMLVVCLALYFFLGRTLGLGGVSSTADATGFIFATTPTFLRPASSASVPGITQTRPAAIQATPTFTPVPPAPTPVPSPTRIRHRVQPGDTLSTIAEKYDVSVQSIMRANNLRNDVIRIGDELIIPYPTPTPAH